MLIIKYLKTSRLIKLSYNYKTFPSLAHLVEHLTVVVLNLWLSNGSWFDSSKTEYLIIIIKLLLNYIKDEFKKSA